MSYIPPPNNNLPFNFSSSGYTPPDFNDIRFRYPGAVTDLKMAITGSELQRDYLKECRTYVLGYNRYNVQILRHSCTYGGIRDLAVDLFALNNFLELEQYIKSTAQEYSDINEIIRGWKTENANISEIIKVWRKEVPTDLHTYLKQGFADSTNLSAYLHTFQRSETNIKALIKSWFREAEFDLLEAIKPTRKDLTNIPAYIKSTTQQTFDLQETLHGWAEFDLLEAIKPTHKGVEDIFTYIKSKINQTYDLPTEVYKIWQHSNLNLQKTLYGWAVLDLNFLLQAFNYSDIGASIRSTYMNDLAVFLQTIQPVDLPADMYGWAVNNLLFSTTIIKSPWDFQFFIEAIPPVNLPMSLKVRKAVASPFDLNLNVSSYYRNDLSFFLNTVSGADLNMLLTASGQVKNLLFKIYPKVVYVKTFINVSYLENKDLGFMVNYPCYGSDFRNLNFNLFSSFSSNMRFNVFGTDGSNIKDLSFKINHFEYITQDYMTVKVFNNPPIRTNIDVYSNNEERPITVDYINASISKAGYFGTTYYKDPALLGIGTAKRYIEEFPPPAQVDEYEVNRRYWTANFVGTPYGDGYDCSAVLDGDPSTYQSTADTHGGTFSIRVEVIPAIKLSSIYYRMRDAETGFTKDSIFSVKTEEGDDWFVLEEIDSIGKEIISGYVDCSAFNDKIGWIDIEVTTTYHGLRAHEINGYSIYEMPNYIIKKLYDFEDSLIPSEMSTTSMSIRSTPTGKSGNYSIGSDGTSNASAILSPEELWFGKEIDRYEYYYYVDSLSSDYPILSAISPNGNRLFTTTIRDDGALIRHHNGSWEALDFQANYVKHLTLTIDADLIDEDLIDFPVPVFLYFSFSEHWPGDHSNKTGSWEYTIATDFYFFAGVYKTTFNVYDNDSAEEISLRLDGPEIIDIPAYSVGNDVWLTESDREFIVNQSGFYDIKGRQLTSSSYNWGVDQVYIDSKDTDSSNGIWLFEYIGEDKLKLKVETEEGNQCYVEIESWDFVNRKAIIYVKVPFISSSVDTVLTLTVDPSMADNVDYVGETGSMAANNVWDNNFIAVYHMNQDPSISGAYILDSTSNDNYSTPIDTMSSGSLINADFGKALSFDGISDFISTPDDESFDIINNLTVETRIKPNTIGAGDIYVAKYATGEMEWALRNSSISGTESKISVAFGNSLDSTFESVQETKYEHLTTTEYQNTSFTFSSGIVNIFHDGEKKPSENVILSFWTPAEINTTAWFDASDSSTITIDTGVSQWSDKSGNNKHAIQSTGAYQPTVVTNGLDGKNTLFFDGSANFIITPLTSPATFTGFIVWNKPVSGGVAYQRIYSSSSVSEHDFKNNGVYLVCPTPFDGVGTGGPALDIKEFGTTEKDLSNFHIGRLNAGYYYYYGQIAEFIITDQLDTETYQKIEGYLSWKWGLEANLPIGHPYESVPPIAYIDRSSWIPEWQNYKYTPPSPYPGIDNDVNTYATSYDHYSSGVDYHITLPIKKNIYTISATARRSGDKPLYILFQVKTNLEDDWHDVDDVYYPGSSTPITKTVFNNDFMAEVGFINLHFHGDDDAVYLYDVSAIQEGELIPTTLNNGDAPLTIGNGGPGQNYPSNVSIAEVRVSDVARSDAWLKATNYSLKNELLTMSSVFTFPHDCWYMIRADFNWSSKKADIKFLDVTNNYVYTVDNTDINTYSIDVCEGGTAYSFPNKGSGAIRAFDNNHSDDVYTGSWRSSFSEQGRINPGNEYTWYSDIFLGGLEYLYIYAYISDNDNFWIKVEARKISDGTWETLYDAEGGSRTVIDTSYSLEYDQILIYQHDEEGNDTNYVDYYIGAYTDTFNHVAIGYDFTESKILKKFRIRRRESTTDASEFMPYTFEIRGSENRPVTSSGFITEGDILYSADEYGNDDYWKELWHEYDLDNPTNKSYNTCWLVCNKNQSGNPFIVINEIEILGIIEDSDYSVESFDIDLHDIEQSGTWGNGFEGTSGNFYIDNILINHINYREVIDNDITNLPFNISGELIPVDLNFSLRSYINRNYKDPSTKKRTVVLKLNEGIEDWRRYVELTFRQYAQRYYYFSGNQTAYKEFRDEHWEVKVEGYSLSDLPLGVERSKFRKKYLFNLNRYDSIDSAIRDMIDRVTSYKEFDMNFSVLPVHDNSKDLNISIKTRRIYKSNRVLGINITAI